jgi:hypothetical protein
MFSMKMGYGAILANERVIRLGTFNNLSQNLNLRPWEGEDDEETVPRDIENLENSGDEHESSKDEHEKHQGASTRSSKDERYDAYGPGNIPDVRGALFDPRKFASHVNLVEASGLPGHQGRSRDEDTTSWSSQGFG